MNTDNGYIITLSENMRVSCDYIGYWLCLYRLPVTNTVEDTNKYITFSITRSFISKYPNKPHPKLHVKAVVKTP